MNFDPEAKFWRAVARERQSDLTETRERVGDGPLIFLGGGSSCSFSLHPAVLEEVTGIAAVNLGGSAAMGYRYLTWLATKDAREGDFVILHLEPDILCRSGAWGSSLAAKVGGFHWEEQGQRGAFAQEIFENPWRDPLAALKPGAKFLSALTAKFLSGRDLYRYQISDLEPHGVLTAHVQQPNADIEPFTPMVQWLDDQASRDLRFLAHYAREKKIRIFYTLPWECFDHEALAEQRAEHAHYLQKVSQYLPILDDEMMGALSDNSMFLDTGFHLTPEAGKLRSQLLGEALRRHLELKE